MLRGIICTVAFFTLAFTSCKKDGEKVENPTFSAPSKNFLVVEDFKFQGVPNFEDTIISFSARFNEPVSWFIDVVGSSSGARKTLSGTGQVIDSASVIWDGASDNEKFFRFKEDVYTTLSFYASDIRHNIDTLNIVTKKVFDENCYLVGEFEGNPKLVDVESSADSLYYSSNVIVTQWNKFFDIENKNEEICGGLYHLDPSLALMSNCSDIQLPEPVQGYGYFFLYGQDFSDQPSTFFIGGMNHDAVNYGINEDLDNVYLNFYANSNGNSSTTLKAVVFGANDDEWTKEIDVTWDGWRLISIKLSQLALSKIGGNLSPGYLDTRFIKKVGFNLMSGNGKGPGTDGFIAVDFVTLTVGTPFNQNSN